MRLLWRLRVVLIGALAAALVCSSAAAARAQVPQSQVPQSQVPRSQVIDSAPYYLALGDSLAQGVQPNAAGQSVITNQGYVDDLFAVYRLPAPGLRLAKLGCPGETTGSMIHGGICPYPLGGQLAQAVSFLQSHRVVLVTLDIGANNVDNCLKATGIDRGCITQGLAAVSSDLPIILAALRQASSKPASGQAAGSKVAGARPVPIVAMNYYNPFVAAALQGPTGQMLARQSQQLGQTFNNILAVAYAAFGIPVADVEAAFSSDNFTALPLVNLPLNAVLSCVYTWMCPPPPVGPNIHATPVGYLLISLAFLPKIKTL